LPVCRIPGCGCGVALVIAEEGLCVTHFLDQAFDHASAGLAFSQQSLPLDASTLACLLDDAHLAAQLLTEPGVPLEIALRERILEFLLCVANLHEYAARLPALSAHVN
jgi:hypothetical protein